MSNNCKIRAVGRSWERQEKVGRQETQRDLKFTVPVIVGTITYKLNL